ncbi:MAG: hypothetical protein P8N43_14925, partial [Alphaproteobacteria bacterium]|nr:hypothetical protein [Alphaproteobacteria bacterium]
PFGSFFWSLLLIPLFGLVSPLAFSFWFILLVSPVAFSVWFLLLVSLLGSSFWFLRLVHPLGFWHSSRRP